MAFLRWSKSNGKATAASGARLLVKCSTTLQIARSIGRLRRFNRDWNRRVGKPVEKAKLCLPNCSDHLEKFSRSGRRVKTNLQAEKYRLLFVADVISLELRRIVEFLNEQMDPAEILAIELRQFAGGQLKTIVPTVYGQTQQATRKRGGVVTRWDERTLLDKLALTVGAKELHIARQIYEWMRKEARVSSYSAAEKRTVQFILRSGQMA